MEVPRRSCLTCIASLESRTWTRMCCLWSTRVGLLGRQFTTPGRDGVQQAPALAQHIGSAA